MLARPAQRTPPGDWNVWLMLAGRGFGKTISAAEDMAHYGYTHPGSRLAVIAPTLEAGVDVCMEGDTGLLSYLDPEAILDWNRSKWELWLRNGTRYKVFSSQRPERLRGPRHHRAWCDELASFEYLRDTWDLLLPTMALGERPQIVVTTTPKPANPVLKELLERVGEDVVLSRGSTFDNSANLAPSMIDALRRRFAGTRYERQELYGELIEDVEGALWTWAMIEANRRDLPREGASRTVVAIDPAVTAGEDSDETGIIGATCFGPDSPFARENLIHGEAVSHGFIHADRSGRYSPRGWATAAIELYHELEADRIVAEKNQGGEMVQATLHSVDPNVPITLVHASKGKRTRAEPVSALYEQGRVHHVEPLPELESQLTSRVPGEDGPDDRHDALVWAISDLMLGAAQDYAFSGMETAGAVEEPITADMLTRRW